MRGKNQILIVSTMIEVKARLLRGSVFFAGECIECEIIFTNVADGKKETRNQPCNHTNIDCSNQSLEMDRLAWASAQIHCQCTVNESRVKIWSSNSRTDQIQNQVSTGSNASCTSFVPSRGEEGRCLLSTQPKILFCDLELAPGESRTYFYSDIIPFDGVPSYKGHAVKYSYKITVGTSRVQGQSKLLRLPIRILVLQGLGGIEHFLNKQEKNLHNPFLEDSTPKTSLLDLAVDVLTTLTSRRNSHVYNIVSNRGTVGRFCLFKSAYRIGEEIVGSFDFSESFIICLKFSAVLQSEEHIPEDLCNPSKQSLEVTYSSFTSVQENCLHTKKTHLVLPIPFTACPEFVSDLVCLKWRLHFEFTLASSPLPAGASPVQLTPPYTDVATWQGPPDIDAETMTWDLPVKIIATNPLHASSISMHRTSSTMVF